LLSGEQEKFEHVVCVQHSPSELPSSEGAFAEYPTGQTKSEQSFGMQHSDGVLPNNGMSVTGLGAYCVALQTKVVQKALSQHSSAVLPRIVEKLAFKTNFVLVPHVVL